MNVVGGVRNAMSSVTGAAGMLGAGVGVAAVGSGINDAYRLNRRAVLLSTASQMPGTTATPAGQLTGAVRSVASETGAASEDIMSSMESVSAKGGGAAALNKYLKDMRELTKLAVANGIAMEDMGGVVAAAYDAGVEPGEDLLGLVRSLIVQGRAGSVEFKDFAEELARLGGAGSRFGSGTRMLQDIGGLTQLSAVVSGGDVKGARTTVIDLMREFSQGPKISMMGEMGVRTHDANGMRNAGDVMAEVITAIEEGASPEKIPGMNAEQKKKLSPEQQKAALTAAIFTGKSGELAGLLQKTYKTGFTTSTGEKLTGHEAVKARIEEASRPYGMSKEDAAADYARIAKVQELARAHEDFKNKMAELLPEVTKLIPVLVKAADGFAKLVVWLAKNPLEGLGAFMMASFAKELTNAALSKTIEQGFANITTSLATGKGSGGALGALGAIGTIALTAGVVYLAAKAGLDKIFETGAEEGKGGFSAVMSNVTTSGEAQRAIARGSITPEERERLVKKMDEENVAASRASDSMNFGNIRRMVTDIAGPTAGNIAGVLSAPSAPTPFAAIEQLMTRTARQQGTNREETDAVVTKNAALITALGNLTTAVNSSGGGLANPVPGPRTEPAARAGLK